MLRRLRAFTPAEIDSDGIDILSFLENMNVHVYGEPWSYSQRGDYTSATWDVVGESIDVVGPRGPGKLIKKNWDIHDKLILIVGLGRSNGNGFTQDWAGNPDLAATYTTLAPFPGRLLCSVGGVSPLQTGVTLNSVADLVSASQYQAPPVDVKVNINTGRLPGDEFDQEEWIIATGEVITAAVPSDNLVLLGNFSIGGATFNQCVATGATVSSLAWHNSGVGGATVVFTAQTNIAIGDTFIFQDMTPSGWNGTKTAISSNGLTVTFTQGANPGAYSSGTFVIWSPPAVNLRRWVAYWAAQAASLGKTCYLGMLMFSGDEGADTIASADSWNTLEWTYFNQLRTELGVIAGNDDGIPWACWPVLDYPCFASSVTPGRQGTANYQAEGVIAVASDPANRLITFSQFPYTQGGPTPSSVAAAHKSVEGHSDRGEVAGLLRIDAANGITSTLTPPVIDESFEVVRVANSKSLSFQWGEEVVIDETTRVTDPGFNGIQLAAGAYSGPRGSLATVGSSVLDPNGIDHTVEFDTLPTDAGGNYLLLAWANADAAPATNSIKFTAISWAANVATFTTESAHGINVGDAVSVVFTYPVAYDFAGVAATGTTGSTLKLALVGSDPGTLALPSASWAAGIATFNMGITGNQAQVGSFFNTTGFAVVGFNVTGGTIRSVTDTAFTATMPISPLAASDAGGGQALIMGRVSIQGQYFNGPTKGQRNQFRRPNIVHHSQRSGFPYPQFAPHQIIPITSYGSTKKIVTTLTNLNMSFPLVMDYGDTNCYAGSGDTLTNLGSSGATNNYTRAGGTKPAFHGVAGDLNRTCYFGADVAGGYFIPAGTPDVWVDAHKATGIWTWFLAGHVPASFAGVQYLFATCDGTAAGVRVQISPTLAFSTSVTNAAGQVVYTQSHGFLAASSYFVLAGSIEMLNSASWMYNSNVSAEGIANTPASAGFKFFTPTFAFTPATGAAQSILYAWANGSAGAVKSGLNLQEGSRIAGNTWMQYGAAIPLIKSMTRRQLEDL